MQKGFVYRLALDEVKLFLKFDLLILERVCFDLLILECFKRVPIAGP